MSHRGMYFNKLRPAPTTELFHKVFSSFWTNSGTEGSSRVEADVNKGPKRSGTKTQMLLWRRCWGIFSSFGETSGDFVKIGLKNRIWWISETDLRVSKVRQGENNAPVGGAIETLLLWHRLLAVEGLGPKRVDIHLVTMKNINDIINWCSFVCFVNVLKVQEQSFWVICGALKYSFTQ